MLAPLSTRMRIGLSDLSFLLNVPLQPSLYPGTSGLGGGAELDGLPKPICMGRVYNIAPVYLGSVDLGDGALPTYQAHWRTVSNFSVVRDSGVSLTEKTTAGAPAAGQYKQSKTNGAFQLGAEAAGVVTCDCAGEADGSYVSNTGAVLVRLLTSRGPIISASLLETATFDDIDAVMPGEIGIYFGPREVSAIAAVDQILAHAALVLAGGRNGKLRLTFADPVFGPVIKLTEPEIVACGPAPLPSQLQPAPVHIDIVAEKNWAPLTLSDVAGSVTDAARRKLQSPGKRARATSSSLNTRQLPDRVLRLEGLFRLKDDAQARANRLRDFIEPGLAAFRVTTDRYPGVVEIGDVIFIESYPRWGLAGGFTGIVADWDEVPHLSRTTMTLIGAAP